MSTQANQTPAVAMFMQIGRKRYPIADFADASDKFCAARDAWGEGYSNTPTPLIVDAAGNTIAHVSYNGRVWPGETYQPGIQPLFG